MILALPIILKEHFISLAAMLFYYMDVNRGTKSYRYLNSFTPHASWQGFSIAFVMVQHLCKVVFNFALRHDLAILQDGLSILNPIGQWAES